MPNIRERTDVALDLRPTEVGAEATAAAARRGGAFFNTASGAMDALGARIGSTVRDVGDVYVKDQDHQQISAGAANGAQLISNLNKDWNETAKNGDPSDPTHAAKWREETLEPKLEQFRSGFTTEKSQQWAEHFVDQYRSHMFQKTTADMSTLAADAVHVNTLKTINSLGNTLSSDPSGLDFARNTLKSSIDGLVDSSPNLTAAQAAKVRTDLMFKGEEHLVKSAVMGAITNGGDWKKLASDPKNSPYINAQEMIQFEKAARGQDRTDRLQQKQIENYQHQQNVQAAHSEVNRIMTDTVTIDPQTGRPIVKPEYFKRMLDIAKNNPDAPDGLVRTGLDWGERQQNLKDAPTRSDPSAKQNLIDGMFRTDKPTTEIDLMRAQVDGKITHADFAAMHQLWKGLEQAPMKEPIFLSTLHGVKQFLGTDPVGARNYSSFVEDFAPQYIAAKKAGTAPPNALDLKDPKSMISQTMAPYKRDPATIMLDKYTRGEGVFGDMNLTGPGKGTISTTVQDKPITLPPLDKRAKDKVYPTPSGPKRWTGTAWVDP